MAYVDDVMERVVRTTPSEPEFHQAVKEVLESLRPIIALKEDEYRKTGDSGETGRAGASDQVSRSVDRR